VNPQSQPPAANQPSVPQQPSLLERIFSHWFVSWVLIPAALIFFLHYYVFSAYHVIGNSMLPTLHDTDYLIISKVDHTKSLVENKKYIPARGQIIVFHYPKQPEFDFVKRVVGLPRDRVVIQNGQVTVYSAQDGQAVKPDQDHQTYGNYTEGDSSGKDIDLVVPEGNLFVLGDNRTPGGSSDSREWGFLPSEDIVGNVVMRLYPFSNVHIF
jgi:signal peptidase I